MRTNTLGATDSQSAGNNPVSEKKLRHPPRKRPVQELTADSEDEDTCPIKVNRKPIGTRTMRKRLRTPPSDNISETGSTDEYSFQTLRGKLVSFGKEHNEHFTKINLNKNKTNKTSVITNVTKPLPHKSKVGMTDLLNKKNISLKNDIHTPLKSGKGESGSKDIEQGEWTPANPTPSIECGNVTTKINPGSRDCTHTVTQTIEAIEDCYLVSSLVKTTHRPVLQLTNIKTPVTKYRVTPRIKPEQIEATDKKNASVKKLSEWLADDPFHQQKHVVVRKGTSIIAKSRAFEKDESNIVVKEKAQFRPGKVSEGKNWLRNAFKNDKEDIAEEEETHQSVEKKKKKLEYAFRRKN